MKYLKDIQILIRKHVSDYDNSSIVLKSMNAGLH